MFGSMHTYTSVLDRSMEAERISVSVLGTGPLGLALATRLAEAGAEVRLGSRSVSANQKSDLTNQSPCHSNALSGAFVSSSRPINLEPLSSSS